MDRGGEHGWGSTEGRAGWGKGMEWESSRGRGWNGRALGEGDGMGRAHLLASDSLEITPPTSHWRSSAAECDSATTSHARRRRHLAACRPPRLPPGPNERSNSSVSSDPALEGTRQVGSLGVRSPADARVPALRDSTTRSHARRRRHLAACRRPRRCILSVLPSFGPGTRHRLGPPH